MFPIDSKTCDYDPAMLDSFDALVAEKWHPWKLRDILPGVLSAGYDAGRLTPEGAKLLDPPAPWRQGFRWRPPRAMPVPAWRPPMPWPSGRAT